MRRGPRGNHREQHANYTYIDCPFLLKHHHMVKGTMPCSMAFHILAQYDLKTVLALYVLPAVLDLNGLHAAILALFALPAILALFGLPTVLVLYVKQAVLALLSLSAVLALIYTNYDVAGNSSSKDENPYH